MSEHDLSAFRPVLDALTTDSRYLGGGRVRLEHGAVEVRRFSNVLRVTVDRDGERSRIFIKILKPEAVEAEERELLQTRVADEFASAQRVRRHFEPHEGLSAVRAIACFPEHLALVTQEVAGETLLDLLIRRAAWYPDARTVDELCLVARRIGRWLRIFQQLENPNRRLSLAAMRDYIDVRLNTLVESDRAPFSAADRLAVLRYFDEQSASVSAEELDEVLIHADLALSNVLVSGTAVTVIDFAEPRYDVPGHDITHLLMQIDLLAAKPKFRRAVISRLQSALLEGCGDTVDPSQPLFRLLQLKQVLCHYATLATRPASRVERVYNWYIQWRHQLWLASLLRQSGPSSTRFVAAAVQR